MTGAAGRGRAGAAGPASGATIEVRHLGEEREPVVIIDAATGQGDALVEYAATRSRFEAASVIGSAYPGLLGPAPTAYLDALVRLVIPLISRYFGEEAAAPARAWGNFGLVATAPDLLTPEQRTPHVDAADDMQFAAVHYLCRGNPDGTGFFRHRSTRYETLSASRLADYRARLEAELAREPPRMGYVTGGGPLFERIGACEARFDRLVLYRASLLHSGLITKVPTEAADPRRGRLTGNLFLQCRGVSR